MCFFRPSWPRSAPPVFCKLPPPQNQLILFSLAFSQNATRNVIGASDSCQSLSLKGPHRGQGSLRMILVLCFNNHEGLCGQERSTRPTDGAFSHSATSLWLASHSPLALASSHLLMLRSIWNQEIYWGGTYDDQLWKCLFQWRKTETAGARSNAAVARPPTW